jgi:Tol biopolymer transport system component
MYRQPGVSDKYDSGRKRSHLFRQRAPLPLSLVVLGLVAAIFWLVPTNRPAVNQTTAQDPQSITLPPPTPTSTPLPRPTSEHGKRIVFTCTRGDFNQICLINADGTGYQQLTQDGIQHYYPSFSPLGDSILFASNRTGSFEIYLLLLNGSKLFQLTKDIGNAFAPSFSTDGENILFLNRAADGPSSIWMMGRTGENPRLVFAGPQTIVNAAWSPQGDLIAFAMETSAAVYDIFTIPTGVKDPIPTRRTQNIEGITGSLDWSPDGKSILICAGPAGDKNVYRLDLGDSALTQLTFGGNNAAAAYSSDGEYIVFNSLRNNNQADLFIIRSDGHSTRQLTDNPEPDWQPRWEP